jgi:hydrogenase maturation factor HypF (carbamoyltransferase family)
MTERDRLPTVEESIAAAKDRLANAKARLDKQRPPKPVVPSVVDAETYDQLAEENDEH